MIILSGAGCGLSSIVLAMQGYRVVSTDKSSVIKLTEKNIFDNLRRMSINDKNMDGKINLVTCVDLNWDSIDALDPHVVKGVIKSDFDIILMSDCIYQSSSIEPLMKTIKMVSDIYDRMST